MFGGMNMGKMAKQVEEMQKKMSRLQEDLKERIVEATSGGGMVTVKVNGAGELVDVKVEPDVLDPDEKGMLEDLIIAAVNEGIKKATKLRETEMQKITGMALPGLM